MMNMEQMKRRSSVCSRSDHIPQDVSNDPNTTISKKSRKEICHMCAVHLINPQAAEFEPAKGFGVKEKGSSFNKQFVAGEKLLTVNHDVTELSSLPEWSPKREKEKVTTVSAKHSLSPKASDEEVGGPPKPIPEVKLAHPEYAETSRRVLSWPADWKISPELLAQADFFYEATATMPKRLPTFNSSIAPESLRPKRSRSPTATQVSPPARQPPACSTGASVTDSFPSPWSGGTLDGSMTEIGDGDERRQSLHRQIYRTLGKNMPEHSQQFRDFLYHVPLSARDKEQCGESMEVLLERWELRGGVGLLNYDNLLNVWKEAGINSMVTMIEPMIKEIKQLSTEGDIPQNKVSPKDIASPKASDEEVDGPPKPIPEVKFAHPEYSEMSRRVSSFPADWKKHQTPELLAEAGFFYGAPPDRTRCYFCNGGLQNWLKGDDPFVEHARWFPDCGHLRNTKGDDYAANFHQSLWTESTTKANGTDRHQKMSQKIAEEMESLRVENERPKNELNCSTCKAMEASVLFQPCGHLVACSRCADELKDCSACGQLVLSKVHVLM